VCKVLEYQGLPTFATVNVLDDADLRTEIKQFTSWPTIPQVFIRGQFVGGCDILLDMNQSGQLKELLAKEGLLEKEDSGSSSDK
jgi:monothiol glutaredoxin